MYQITVQYQRINNYVAKTATCILPTITVEPLYKGHVGIIILVLITEVSTFQRFVIERFQCILTYSFLVDRHGSDNGGQLVWISTGPLHTYMSY